MLVRKGLLRAAGLVLGFGAASGAMAQGRQLTTADYAQAERFMNYNVNPLVYHGVERPTWMADGRFWYRDSGPGWGDVCAGRSGEGDEGAGVRSGEAGGCFDDRDFGKDEGGGASSGDLGD